MKIIFYHMRKWAIGIFEIYEPKRKISSRESKVRFVRKHIMDLQDYFSYTKLYDRIHIPRR